MYLRARSFSLIGFIFLNNKIVLSPFIVQKQTENKNQVIIFANNYRPMHNEFARKIAFKNYDTPYNKLSSPVV